MYKKYELVLVKYGLIYIQRRYLLVRKQINIIAVGGWCERGVTFISIL